MLLNDSHVSGGWVGGGCAIYAETGIRPSGSKDGSGGTEGTRWNQLGLLEVVTVTGVW